MRMRWPGGRPSRTAGLRLLLGLAVVATLAALHPGVVLDTLRSPRGLLLVLATVLASRLLSRAGRRYGRWPAMAAGWFPIAVVG